MITHTMYTYIHNHMFNAYVVTHLLVLDNPGCWLLKTKHLWSRVNLLWAYCMWGVSLSLSIYSGSIDSSVGRITLLPPEGLEFDPGLGHNWVGYGKVFTSKSAEESQTWNPTGLPDLRSPRPGIIHLAGRTAGKSPVVSPRLLGRHRAHSTGWTPAAGKQKAARQYRTPRSRPGQSGSLSVIPLYLFSLLYCTILFFTILYYNML